MDSLRNLRENIVADRLSLLALVVVVVMVLANVLVVWKFILPAWQDRRELTSQLASAEKELEEALKVQQASPGELRKQVEAAQTKLDDAASAFFSDSQATEALNKLYQYAIESQVEITDRQIVPVPEEEKKDSYDVGKFQLQVKGALPNLVDFVSRIEEAVFESFIITNVNITEAEEQHALSMDIALYTSPLSSGAVVQPTPGVTVIPSSLAQMEETLVTAWASGEWELAIGLIEQILALEPDYAGMTEKLYAAHVNYGYQLLGEGDPDGATAQFNNALEIQSDGVEALAGLQQAATWVPMPTPVPTAPTTPAPTLTAEEQLAQSLHEPWSAKDWETVIGLIGQILAINPGYDDMTEKLYAAHVNYGQQLVAEGRLEEAKVEFTRALDVNPDGGEAMAELKALAGEPVPPATPTPQSQQYTIHVVQRGENLYRISLRYGTTVQAIMAANGLTNYNIYVGQRLRIPLQ
ncbi:MAG: LysM peptidoglycan-binding domain-containing protein [Anaerolineales bacterium]|nr:LysM peptidoglycan-binding domain-containing protein [Anaerolineales bacterium]